MKIGTILLAILAVLSMYLGYSYFSEKAAAIDTVPPTIQVSSNRIEANVGVTDAELLEYVTAYDVKDGDLTDRVLVEKMVKDTAGAKNEFTVTYVVFDKDNNLARTSAQLFLRDYHQARFSLHEPLRIQQYNGMLWLKKPLSVEDCIDGNVYPFIQISGLDALEGDKIEPGFYDLLFSVTNSMGDTTYLPMQLEVYEMTYEQSLSPSFMLSDYIVYASEEEPYDYLENLLYVKDVGGAYQVDSEDMVSVYTYRGKQSVTKAEYDGKFGKWIHVSKIEYTTDVDYSKPGVYTGNYFYTSEDSGYEAHTTVYIVVE